MANPKNAAWYGGGLGMFLLPGANLADNSLFYVDDTAGLDANDGLTPMTAYKTITHALTHLVAGMPNYVIVLRYGNFPAGEGWPIVIGQDKTQLIAAQYGSDGPATYLVADAAACLTVDADDVRVQGFMVRPAVGSVAVLFTGDHRRASILDCRFDIGTYGLYSAMGGISWGLDVERCHFVGNLTGGGISLQDDPASIRIHNNVFKCNEGAGHIAIDILNGGEAEITHNQFSIEQVGATGHAVTLQVNTNAAFVNNNWAATGVAVPPINPYRDLGGAVAPNAWGLNYMGLTPTYPVFV